MLLTESGKLVKALDIELGFNWGRVRRLVAEWGRHVGKGFPGRGHSVGKGMEE